MDRQYSRQLADYASPLGRSDNRSPKSGNYQRPTMATRIATSARISDSIDRNKNNDEAQLVYSKKALKATEALMLRSTSTPRSGSSESGSRRYRARGLRTPRSEPTRNRPARLQNRNERRSASPKLYHPFLLSTMIPEISLDPTIATVWPTTASVFQIHQNSWSRIIGNVPSSSLQEGMFLSEELNDKWDAYIGKPPNLVLSEDQNVSPNTNTQSEFLQKYYSDHKERSLQSSSSIKNGDEFNGFYGSTDDSCNNNINKSKEHSVYSLMRDELKQNENRSDSAIKNIKIDHTGKNIRESENDSPFQMHGFQTRSREILLEQNASVSYDLNIEEDLGYQIPYNESQNVSFGGGEYDRIEAYTLSPLQSYNPSPKSPLQLYDLSPKHNLSSEQKKGESLRTPTERTYVSRSPQRTDPRPFIPKGILHTTPFRAGFAGGSLHTAKSVIFSDESSEDWTDILTTTKKIRKGEKGDERSEVGGFRVAKHLMYSDVKDKIRDKARDMNNENINKNAKDNSASINVILNPTTPIPDSAAHTLPKLVPPRHPKLTGNGNDIFFP